jgi:beta-propeller repeat-containing protein
MRAAISVPILLTLSLLLVLPSRTLNVSATSLALPIEKTWGGSGNDVGTGIALDSLSNIYVTGGTTSFGGGLILLKYNSTGNLVWQELYAGKGAGNAIATDSSDNIYAAGTNGTSVLLLKFSTSGTLQWQRAWGANGSYATGIAVDSASGNVYVTGAKVGILGNGSSAVLLNFNSAGELIWQTAWGGGSRRNDNYGCAGYEQFYDSGFGVAVDGSGHIYVGTNRDDYTLYIPIGNPGCTVGSIDQYLGRSLSLFNSSGSQIWIRGSVQYGSRDVQGKGVAIDPSGNIYLVGWASNYLYAFHYPSVMLEKYSPAGSRIWNRTWGGSGPDEGFGVAVNPLSSNVYVTGYTTRYGGGTDAILLKLTSSGILLWNKIYGGAKDNHSYAVLLDSSGNPIVTGDVSEGPPRNLTSGNSTLGSYLNGFEGAPSYGSPYHPSLPLMFPSGSMSTPSGSESYAGGADVFLIKTGDLQMVTFTMNPSVGTVIFNSTTYGPLQNGNYTVGTASASANPPPGYYFKRWDTSGGISVASNTTNPTTVIIKGSGILTAIYKSPSLASLNLGAIIISGFAAPSILIAKKRRIFTRN